MNRVRTRLIVNADDFGLSVGISDAIVRAHAAGVLSSATLMANMPAAGYAALLARTQPRLGVGVHLNLTLGRPLAPSAALPDLLDAQGEFRPRAALWRQLRNGERLWPQLLTEFTAQVQRALELGVRPTHLDSHEHLANHPLVLRALGETARRFGIRAARTNYVPYRVLPDSGAGWRGLWRNLRAAPEHLAQRRARRVLAEYDVCTPDCKVSFTRVLPRDGDALVRTLRLLDSLPAGCVELAFHPGAEGGVAAAGRTASMRATDDAVLAAPGLRARLLAGDIRLIRFDELDAAQATLALASPANTSR